MLLLLLNLFSGAIFCFNENSALITNYNEILITAVQNNDLTLVKKALANRADPNIFDKKDGRCVLRIAVVFGMVEIVGILLKNKADPNKIYSNEEDDEVSVLSGAIEYKQEQIVQLLKDHGAVLREDDPGSWPKEYTKDEEKENNSCLIM